MPTEIFKVTQLLGRKADDTITVRDMQQILTELNKALSEIGKTFGATRGQDEAVPKFVNDIDMDHHDILNVGQVKSASRPRAFTGTQFTGEFSFQSPAEAPASATLLRDDLDGNVLPRINEAIKQLGATVKALVDIVQV
jgi:hypothetical protein